MEEDTMKRVAGAVTLAMAATMATSVGTASADLTAPGTVRPIPTGVALPEAVCETIPASSHIGRNQGTCWFFSPVAHLHVSFFPVVAVEFS
jgi:hypothetical protein